MGMSIIVAIVVGLICLGIGIAVGIVYRKKVAEKEIGSAELEATRLINEAIRSGENRKKEMLLKPRMKSINHAQNTTRMSKNAAPS